MGIARRGQILKKTLLFGFLSLPPSQGSLPQRPSSKRTSASLPDNELVLDSKDVGAVWRRRRAACSFYAEGNQGPEGCHLVQGSMAGLEVEDTGLCPSPNFNSKFL